MWSYIWPALLVVGANLVYHVTTKETPHNVDPFLSLVVTYFVGALVSLALYFVTSHEKQALFQALKGLNWATYLLGVAIVGLEAGNIYLYRAGWKISVAPLVCNTTVAVLLLVVGILYYKEILSVKQVIGAALCAAGLVFING